MPEEKYSDLAELFKVFGDVTRIKILSLLLNGELSVGDVADGLEMMLVAGLQVPASAFAVPLVAVGLPMP